MMFTDVLNMWLALVLPYLPWVGAAIGFNIFFGIVRSLVEKRFDWQLLTKYVISDLLPVVVWLMLALFSLAPELPNVGSESSQAVITLFGLMPSAALLGIFVKEISSIMANIQALNALPDVVKNIIKKIGVDHENTDSFPQG